MRHLAIIFLTLLLSVLPPEFLANSATGDATATKGDVNDDGVIDGKDALKIIMVLEGRIPQPEQSDPFWMLADVFPTPGTEGRTIGDGQITRDDALKILRYVAGVVSAGEITGDFGEPSISDFSPKSGSPGTEVMLIGANFVSESTAENMVTCGGVLAEIKTATATELSVVVPEGAQTGPITVMTPGGWATSPEDFIVTQEATFKFEPPAGENKSFTVYTLYDEEEPAQDGTARVAVDNANWTLANAMPSGESMSVYMRLHFPVGNAATQSQSGIQPLSRCYQESVTAMAENASEEVSAQSTAQTLVFLCPFFMTPNIEDADRMMSIIENDAAVAQLASVIEDVYPDTDAPFSDQRLTDALLAAIESVGNSIPDGYGLGGSRQSLMRTISLYDNEPKRTIDILQAGQSIKVDTIQTNPLDWIIRVAELKRDELYDMFPQGGYSMVNAERLKSYPRERDGFNIMEMRLGKAITRRFGIITTLMGDLVGSLGLVDSGGDAFIELPDKDSVFIVRSFAPVFNRDVDNGELEFILNSPYGVPGKADLDSAIQLNMVMLVIDAADGVLGIYNAFSSHSRREIMRASLAACSRAMVREFPYGYDEEMSDDKRSKKLTNVFKDTLDAFLKQYTIEAANGQLGKLESLAKNVGGVLLEVVKTATGVLKVLEIISYLGPIGERLAGMAGVGLIEAFDLELSPMETAFVMVGNPFDWVVEEVVPAEAARGDEVRLTGKNFDFREKNNNEIWLMEYGKNPVVHGGSKVEVISVNEDGTELKFKVPPNQQFDEFFIWLKTPYSRKGIPEKTGKSITIKKVPHLFSLSPTRGFAPGTAYPFEDFPGAKITLTGSSFAWGQKVFFGDTEADGSIKSETTWDVNVPQLEAGDVDVYVKSPDEFESERLIFTVIGPPVISGIEPSEARIGELVVISGQNFGNSKDEVKVELIGYQYAKVLSVKDSEIAFQMPTIGQAGDTFQVKVWTPAGQSSAVNITRLQGVVIPQHTSEGEGYSIPVGTTEAGMNPDGNISLNEAAAFASGAENPYAPPWDDDDTDDEPHNPGTLEEGDYVSGDHGGKNYQDTIRFVHSSKYYYASGLELDNFDTLNGDDCYLDLGGGKLTLNNCNSVSMRKVRNTSGVIINGDSNYLAGYLPPHPSGVVHFEGKVLGDGVTIKGIDNEVIIFLLDGCDGHGVYVERGHVNKIGATIEDCTGDGIRITNGQENYIGATIKNCDGNGVTFSGGQNNPGERHEWTYCSLTAENCRYGLKIENSHGNSVGKLSIKDCSESGIYIQGDDNTIPSSGHHYCGENYGYGIELVNAKMNTIAAVQFKDNLDGGVYIGEGSKHNSLTGLEVLGSYEDGILIEGSETSNNEVNGRIGAYYTPEGPFELDGNLKCGVHIRGGAHHNSVINSWIGDNRSHGVLIEGSTTSYNTISSCEIGATLTNPGGNLSFGNYEDGVRIRDGASFNTISDCEIADNGGNGVTVEGTDTLVNKIESNLIGCNVGEVDGNPPPRPNHGFGIVVSDNATGTQLTENIIGVNLEGGIHLNGGVESHVFANGICRYDNGTVYIEGAQGYGIRLDNASDTLSEYNSVYGHDVGIALFGSETVNNVFQVGSANNSSGVGIVIDQAQNNTFDRITVRDSGGHGISVTGGKDNYINPASSQNGGDGVYLFQTDGTVITPSSITENGGSGLVIDSCQNVSATSAEDAQGCNRNTSRGVDITNSHHTFLQWCDAKENGGDGVVVRAGSTNTIIDNCSTQNSGGAGVRLVETSDVTIYRDVPGPDAWLIPSISDNADAGIFIDNCQNIQIGDVEKDNEIRNNTQQGIFVMGEDTDEVTIANCWISSNEAAGIKVESGTVRIGGYTANEGNSIEGNPVGILAKGAETKVDILSNNIGSGVETEGNEIGIKLAESISGVSVDRNTINANKQEGIVLTGGTHTNLIFQNTVTDNGSDGILVEGGSTQNNTITSNSITNNFGKGIRLSGGNDMIEAPVINSISPHIISGSTNAPNGSTVEVYADIADEGEVPIGATHVKWGYFSVNANLPFGMNFHATVTDPDGNTSEFGPYKPTVIRVTKYTFTSTRDGNEEIYAQVGSTLMRLTEDDSADHTPKLGPNGERVAFVSERSGNPDLWQTNIGGTELTQLTDDAAPDYEPTWSMDGTTLAFVSERGGNPDLYILNLLDRTVTQLTNTPDMEERYPCFAPDDSQIAFAARPIGVPNAAFDLYVMKADGSEAPTPLTTTLDHSEIQPVWYFDWSSAESKIAFASDATGNWDIWTMDADGNNPQNLTNSPTPESAPCWTGEGELLFSSERDGGWEIYQMQADGGNVRRLTTSLGGNTQPSAR